MTILVIIYLKSVIASYLTIRYLYDVEWKDAKLNTGTLMGLLFIVFLPILNTVFPTVALLSRLFENIKR